MSFRTAGSSLGAFALLAAGLAGVSMAAPSAANASVGTAQVTVGSFNISGVNNDAVAHGNFRRWKKRRGVVVKQILGAHLDVVGLQEANMSHIYKRHLVHGKNQYLDVLNGLNAGGGHYKLTARAPYNCQRAWSKQHCHYKNRGASADNRIIYNTDTVSMVSHGYYIYKHQSKGKVKRTMTWAKFASRSDGREFLFTSTHLDPHKKKSRTAQWRELIAQINSLKGSLPVIAVGDFNSSKYDSYTKRLLPAMKDNGYGDVLNQSYNESAPHGVRAQSLTNAWINSFNGYRRSAKVFGYSHARSNIGNGIDWVFASNNLTVTNYRVVVDMNPRTLKLKGVIPSDHNLITATIAL